VTALNFIFAFVLMLGVLITVHEFGHFIVAKWCGVRVLKFSIGFGPPIGFGRVRLRWERGGTEYVVAWIPLGGFVKMLGEIPGEEESPEVLEDPEGALGAKPVWQKLSVIFAGPGMNLLLPVLIFLVSLMVGLQRPASVVGAVEEGSPAAAAGLLPGDVITAIDGQPVRFWREVEERVRTEPGASLALDLERGDESLSATLEVAGRAGLDIFRQRSEVGWLGLQHRRVSTVLGVADDASPAAHAGLRSGDRVEALAGEPVEDWPSLADAYARAGGAGEVVFTLEERGELTVPALGDLDALGVAPATVLISDVSPDSAASDAGLEPGDLILTLDDRPVGSFASFAESVRASEGRTLRIGYARAGDTVRVDIAPRLVQADTGMGREEAYMVGIRAEDATLPGSYGQDRALNPLVALPRAVAMTWERTALMLRAVGKIIVGDISRKQIGGPIEIARQAHSAFEAGWEVYINLLIMISINLAILNLLPIPVLDGGQAVLFALEGIKRAPLSLRTREIAMQIGVTMVIMLMGFAFWNDLSRYWSSFVDWLRSSAGL
jgi:regulator of sigma E protease